MVYSSLIRGLIKKTTIVLLAIVTIILLIFQFYPIKTAVKLKDINIENVIVCKRAKITDVNWEIVGGQYGLNDFMDEKTDADYINIVGNTPINKLSGDVTEGINRYAFKGKFLRTEDFGGQRYRVFEVYQWDIIYPIDRFSLRTYISPKRYLTIFDYENIGAALKK